MKELEKENLGGPEGRKGKGEWMQFYLITTVFFKKERKKIEHYEITTLFESSLLQKILW